MPGGQRACAHSVVGVDTPASAADSDTAADPDAESLPSPAPQTFMRKLGESVVPTEMLTELRRHVLLQGRDGREVEMSDVRVEMRSTRGREILE